nr:leucine-rich repeat protein [Lachnospiraceae bacterium]
YYCSISSYPTSYIIDPEGHFKLGDFGIARQLELTTGAYTRVGTPFYSAPEVAEGKRYDRRADIYSLGLVMYRLLNGGRLPFMPEKRLMTPADRRNALERRLSGEAIPAPVNASESLAATVVKACAPKAGNRYENAAAFREALEAVQREAAVPWWKTRIVRFAAVLAAVILVGGLAVLIGRGMHRAANTPVIAVTDKTEETTEPLGKTGPSSSGQVIAVSYSAEHETEPVSEAGSAEDPAATETPAAASETLPSATAGRPGKTSGKTKNAEPETDSASAAEPDTTTPDITESTMPALPETTAAVTTESTAETTTAPTTAAPTTAAPTTAAPTTAAPTTAAPTTEAHTHKYSVWTVTKQPTCTSAGQQKRTCTCGAEETEKIAALGHDFSDWTITKEVTCTADGKKQRVCSRCGKKETETIAHTGHDNEWVVTKEPTCTENGKEQLTCRRCGRVSDERTIDALGHELSDGTCIRCGGAAYHFTVSADGSEVHVTAGDKSIWTKQELTIPASYQGLPVTAIDPVTFREFDFTTVTLPDGLRSIGTLAFSNGGIDSITIPASVVTAKDAFDAASITDFRLGSGMTDPPDFGKGGFITNLYTSDSMTKLDTSIIRAHVNHLYIGASVTEIDSANYQMFYRHSISISPSNTHFRIAGTCVIENATGHVVLGFESEQNGINIPAGEGIKVIKSGAFGRCHTPLASLVIPDGVERIENHVIEIQAFRLSLPSSLKSLGESSITLFSFSDAVVEFRGTKAQWSKVKWTEEYGHEPPFGGTNQLTVVCTDGEVPMDFSWCE